MKNFIRLFALGAFAVTVLSPMSYAIPMGPKIYVGALGGVSSFTDTNTSLSFTPVTFGGTAGVVLPGGFGIGAHVSRFGYSAALGSFSASLTTMNYLGELNYFISMLHFGAKIGETSVTTSATGLADSSTSNTTYGGTVGLDIPLGLFSIGGEGSYLKYNGAGSSLLFLGALKVSF